MLDEGKKASLQDSLYLLLDLIYYVQSDNIKRAKTRIKEYGYIADPKFIMKMLSYIKEEGEC